MYRHVCWLTLRIRFVCTLMFQNGDLERDVPALYRVSVARKFLKIRTRPLTVLLL